MQKKDRVLIKTKMPLLRELIGNGVELSFKKFTKMDKINNPLYARKRFGKWKKHLKDYNYVILGENYYSYEISKYIKEINPNCKIIIFFWNKLVFPSYFEIIEDSNVDEIYTFDEDEAKKYKFKFNTTFYSKRVKKKNLKIKYDVVFCGRAKDRLDELIKLENKLKNNNINTYFKIVCDEKDYITYKKYLNLVFQSKAILDFNAYNQSGLSLRVMESLFFEKKLITNNKNVKKQKFYNKNNIFILGEDNIKNIDKFINSKYEKVDQKIIDYFDFDSWIKRFK